MMTSSSVGRPRPGTAPLSHCTTLSLQLGSNHILPHSLCLVLSCFILGNLCLACLVSSLLPFVRLSVISFSCVPLLFPLPS